MSVWNPFSRSLESDDRTLRVQVERDGEVSEELYKVSRAQVENGWLKLYQSYPVHKEVRNEDEETERDLEIRTRDLWINKDFIISIEDPYRPHSSEVDLQKIFNQEDQESENR